MHWFYTESLVFSRNSEREARLLDEWRQGRPARQAAINTGTPEGTTYYYYRKFNKDPEKANRLAISLKPLKKLNPKDIMLQSLALQTADETSARFAELIKQGKYPQAEYYIKAVREATRLRREQVSGVNSFTALYMANPQRNAALIPDVAKEWVQMEMEEGHTNLEAIERLKNSMATMLLLDKTKTQAAGFGLAFEALKAEYLSKQAKKKEEETPKAPDTTAGENPNEQPKRKISSEEFRKIVEEIAEKDMRESEKFRMDAESRGQRVTHTPIKIVASRSNPSVSQSAKKPNWRDVDGPSPNQPPSEGTKSDTTSSSKPGRSSNLPDSKRRKG